MKRYVLGLAFTEDGSVVMVRKNRPVWQAGKLNFVGGKVEPNEMYSDTMVREFLEETGVETQKSDWRFAGLMGRKHNGKYDGDTEDHGAFVVSLYVSEPDDKYFECRTVEDEEILIVPKTKFTVDRDYDSLYIGNIRTIYEFATSPDFQEGALLNIEYL